MPQIRVKEGTREAVRDITHEAAVTFGRAPENQLVLHDRESSRYHGYIERVDSGYKLVDMESRNGTRVNGRFVNQHLLKPGDVVTVGRAEIRFEAEVTVPAAPPSPPPAARAQTTRPAPPPPRIPEPPTRRERIPRPAPPASSRTESSAMATATAARRPARAEAAADRDILHGALTVAGILLTLIIAGILLSLVTGKKTEPPRPARSALAEAQAAEERAGALPDVQERLRQWEDVIDMYDAIPTNAEDAAVAQRRRQALEERCRKLREEMDKSKK